MDDNYERYCFIYHKIRSSIISVMFYITFEEPTDFKTFSKAPFAT